MSEQFGKFGRISNDDLATALKFHAAEDIDILRMAEELTVRRAADLTSADREVLSWARELFADRANLGYHEYSERAHAILDRLLSHAGGDK